MLLPLSTYHMATNMLRTIPCASTLPLVPLYASVSLSHPNDFANNFGSRILGNTANFSRNTNALPPAKKLPSLSLYADTSHADHASSPYLPGFSIMSFTRSSLATVSTVGSFVASVMVNPPVGLTNSPCPHQ